MSVNFFHVHSIQKGLHGCAVAIIHARFKFATTLPVCKEELALKDCIALLPYVTGSSKWWSPNMSKLFGPLRPYFPFRPVISIEKHQVFLKLQDYKASSEPSIQYSSTEPIGLKDEYLVSYQRCLSTRLSSLADFMCWAWIVQIGLEAIQKALGRHEFARMSRNNKVRLYVCLVALLKLVSKAKYDSTSSTAPHFLLMGTMNCLITAALARHWNQMKNHL